MREGVGNITLYNMIIIFIFIVFALLAGALSYYKAFKVNSYILFAIDKYEGYNKYAVAQINRDLNTLGYLRENGNLSCPTRGGMEAVKYPGSSDPNDPATNSYYYCVYFYSNDAGATGSKSINTRNRDNSPIYYNYSVVSYIYVDLPIVGNFKIPVHTKGERIYNFSDGQG